MIEIFQQGGLLMYPILFCSVIGWTIFLERIRTYRRIRRCLRPLLLDVERLLYKDQAEAALRNCQELDSPLAKIFTTAIIHSGASRSHIKTLVEEVGDRESFLLQRYLGLLGTIANISPLLGLLGTVLGMIEAFNVIAEQGGGTPATLGGGISQALITTAAGLSVAVPMVLVHRYLSSCAERLTLEMEEYSMRIVDLVGKS